MSCMFFCRACWLLVARDNITFSRRLHYLMWHRHRARMYGRCCCWSIPANCDPTLLFTFFVAKPTQDSRQLSWCLACRFQSSKRSNLTNHKPCHCSNMRHFFWDPFALQHWKTQIISVHDLNLQNFQRLGSSSSIVLVWFGWFGCASLGNFNGGRPLQSCSWAAVGADRRWESCQQSRLRLPPPCTGGCFSQAVT